MSLRAVLDAAEALGVSIETEDPTQPPRILAAARSFDTPLWRGRFCATHGTISSFKAVPECVQAEIDGEPCSWVNEVRIVEDTQ